MLDGVVEPSSKKPKKAVAAKAGAGKRKVREEEEAGDEGHKKRGAVERGVDLESPALRNGEEVDEEDSPAPVKKGRKVVEAKVVAKKEKTNGNAQAAELLGRRMRNGRGAENIESGSEEDMFAASPSPVKKVANREFKEMGSQVSPAFVAAGKEARRKDRVAAAGGKKKDLVMIPTPAMLEVKGKANGKEGKNGVEPEEDVLDNPTPAMMAIIQKRQEAEKAGGSKKKAASKAKKLKN